MPAAIGQRLVNFLTDRQAKDMHITTPIPVRLERAPEAMLCLGEVAHCGAAVEGRDARVDLIAGHLDAHTAKIDARLIAIDRQLEARALEILDDTSVGLTNILFC